MVVTSALSHPIDDLLMELLIPEWPRHVRSCHRGRPPFPVERRPNSLVCASFNPSLVGKGRGGSFCLEAPWGHWL